MKPVVLGFLPANTDTTRVHLGDLAVDEAGQLHLVYCLGDAAAGLCKELHYGLFDGSEAVWVLDRKASAVRSRVDSSPSFEVRSGATGRKSGGEDAARSRAQPRDTNPNSFSSWQERPVAGVTAWPNTLRLLAGAEGQVHLLWHEITSPATPDRQAIQEPRYLYKDPGTGWAEPVSLYDGAPTVQRLAMAVARRGGVQAMVEQDGMLMPLHRNTDSWQADTLAEGYYPTLSFSTADDTLHLAYVAAAPGPDHSRNDVFYRTLAAGAWSGAVPVHRNPAHYSHYPHLEVTAHNERHLVWLEDEDGNVFPDAIYHAFSKEGRQWSAPEKITAGLPGRLPHSVRLELCRDTQNQLHLSWMHQDETGAAITYYTVREGAAWSAPVVLFAEIGMQSRLHMAVDGQDRLHAIWQGSDGKVYYTTSHF